MYLLEIHLILGAVDTYPTSFLRFPESDTSLGLKETTISGSYEVPSDDLVPLSLCLSWYFPPAASPSGAPTNLSTIAMPFSDMHNWPKQDNILQIRPLKIFLQGNDNTIGLGTIICSSIVSEVCGFDVFTNRKVSFFPYINLKLFQNDIKHI